MRFLLRVIIICIQMEAIVAFIGYIDRNLTCNMVVTWSLKLSLRYSWVAFTSSCGNDALIKAALFTKGIPKRSPTFHAKWRSAGDLSGLSILERIGLYDSVWS